MPELPIRKDSSHELGMQYRWILLFISNTTNFVSEFMLFLHHIGVQFIVILLIYFPRKEYKKKFLYHIITKKNFQKIYICFMEVIIKENENIFRMKGN